LFNNYYIDEIWEVIGAYNNIKYPEKDEGSEEIIPEVSAEEYFGFLLPKS
jgi:hypothetical protein